MHKYQIVIYWCQDDEVFVAEVPELSSCIAEGPTQEAALKAVDKAVADWIDAANNDDYPVPEPQGHMKVQSKRQGRGARRHERIEKRRSNRRQTRQDRQSPDERESQ
jgi:predicted RNase H-like HicB family nuclease